VILQILSLRPDVVCLLNETAQVIATLSKREEELDVF
jgi:hypothetical protein